MANTIGLLLLAAPMLLVLFLGLGLLFWRLSKHFADSLIAVIATAIVLPPFASKLLDRAYDAFLANAYLDVLLYGGLFTAISLVVARLIAAQAKSNKD